MEEVSVAMLGTIGGIAFVVGVVAQLFIKPWLKTKYVAEAHAKYSVIFNAVVGALGILLGLVGAFLLNDLAPSAGQIATGLLIGLVGGATATGGAEFLGNLQKSRK